MRARAICFSCSILLLATVMIEPALADSTFYSPKGATTIPHTYFGMHGWGFAGGQTPWPTAFIGAYRTWDSGAVWAYMEPSRGSYDWAKLDSIVSYMQGKGVDVLFTFGRVPPWASSAPGQDCAGEAGQCAPPTSAADWANFAQALASRYKGQIKYYELWNEPNATNYWTGSAQQMAEMAKLVYGAIKQADPGAVVLTPAPQGVNGYEWMNAYFAAGGQQWADVVSFHGYPGYDSEKRANPPETWIRALLNMNAVMAQYGVHKPLWDTEFSWEFNDSLPNETDRAAFVARMFVLHWLYGVDRAYWHMWDGSTGTLWTGSMTPAGRAYEVITRWLAGASLDQCKTQENGTWTCHLVRSNGLQSWILWNVNGRAQVQPDSAWAVQTQYDLDGGSHAIAAAAPVAVSRLPVMVEGAPASTGPDFYVTVSPNSAVMSSSGSAEFKVTLTPVQGFAKQVTMRCSGTAAEQACTPSPSVVKLNGSTPVKVTYTVSGWAPIPLAAVGLILLPGARRRRGAKTLAAVSFMIAGSLVCFSCAGGGGRSQKASALDASSGSYALTLAATSGQIDHGTYVTLDVQ